MGQENHKQNIDAKLSTDHRSHVQRVRGTRPGCATVQGLCVRKKCHQCSVIGVLSSRSLLSVRNIYPILTCLCLIISEWWRILCWVCKKDNYANSGKKKKGKTKTQPLWLIAFYNIYDLFEWMEESVPFLFLLVLSTGETNKNNRSSMASLTIVYSCTYLWGC